MEDNNYFSDKNLEINKEEKYIAEIFELLKSTLKDPDSEETSLIKDLFLKKTMDDTELLNRLKSLK